MASKPTFEPPKLDLSVDRHCAFKCWKDKWTDYAVVTKLDAETPEYQCSMLRYTFTEDTRKIYNTFDLTADEQKDVNVIIQKLETFSKGTVNETMERHTFNQRKQDDGEPFDDFLTDIKFLSKNCNFCATCHDGLLRDRIVAGIRDSQLRQKLLSETKLDLKKAEDICRSKEKATEGVKMFRNEDREEGDVNEVSGGSGRFRRSRGSFQRGRGGYNNNNNRNQQQQRRPPSTTPATAPPANNNQDGRCKFCVRHHQRGRQHCPAYGNACNACGQRNHFQQSKICKRRSLRNLNVDDEDEFDEEEVEFLFLDQLEATDDSSDSDSYDTTDDDTDSDSENEQWYSCDEGRESDVETHTEISEVTNIVKRSRHRPNRRRGKRKIKKTEEEESDDELLCRIGNTEKEKESDDSLSWEAHMPGPGGVVRFKIDTGADVTVAPDEDLPKLGLNKSDIRKTKKKLFGPGRKRIHCLGYVVTKFTWGDKTSNQIVYICKGIKRALLGKPAIRSLNIVQLNMPDNLACAEVDNINAILERDDGEMSQKNQTEEQHVNYPLLKEFPQLYNRLGKIQVGNDINIKLKKGTVPYQAYSPRRIPIPQLEKVVVELKKMLQLGVIRKVDKPTEWCHPIVVVTKPNGDIRLCIDLTKLNAGVERELHPLESVDETLAKLGDECVYMTKVDANSGYWQIPMDEESQELTTFITPIGRFCATRGPYGLTSMQEIFGKKMDVVIEGLKGVAKSTDDFLIYAKTLEILRERSRKLFERFVKYGVTINIKKCEFEKKKMEFLGHQVSEQGILPLTAKMEAIKNFPQPVNIKQLRRFMGMANQMAKFNPDLAEASAPLRSLLSSTSQWLWTAEHTKALNDVKDVIMSPKTLKLYDVSRPTKVRVDGSRLNGISAILYQKHGEHWHPVTCASRYLTQTEKDYYPIENEMLAVTWGCKKLNIYLQGLPHFDIETDHKPLIPILNNKLMTEMSPRIQNMRMKLLRYAFTAHHVPGAKMEDADALSRAPHNKPSETDIMMEEETQCHLNEVIQQMPVSRQ